MASERVVWFERELAGHSRRSGSNDIIFQYVPACLEGKDSLNAARLPCKAAEKREIHEETP